MAVQVDSHQYTVYLKAHSIHNHKIHLVAVHQPASDLPTPYQGRTALTQAV